MSSMFVSSVPIRSLCTPAYVYLGISIAFLIAVFLQNYNNSNNIYCLGSHQCDVSNINVIYLIKIMYIVFWTWVLDLICKSGSSGFAWFLVLLPFLIMFIFIATIMGPM